MDIKTTINITPLHLGVKLGFLLLLNRGGPFKPKKKRPINVHQHRCYEWSWLHGVVMIVQLHAKKLFSLLQFLMRNQLVKPTLGFIGKEPPTVWYTSHFLWQQMA